MIKVTVTIPRGGRDMNIKLSHCGINIIGIIVFILLCKAENNKRYASEEEVMLLLLLYEIDGLPGIKLL